MKSKFYLTIFILIAFFSSCGRFSNKQSEADKNKPIRIVCVSKQLTEILFALGEGDKIVGIEILSTYPPETKNITTVGYHRMLSGRNNLAKSNGGILQWRHRCINWPGKRDNTIKESWYSVKRIYGYKHNRQHKAFNYAGS